MHLSSSNLLQSSDFYLYFKHLGLSKMHEGFELQPVSSLKSEHLDFLQTASLQIWNLLLSQSSEVLQFTQTPVESEPFFKQILVYPLHSASNKQTLLHL